MKIRNKLIIGALILGIIPVLAVGLIIGSVAVASSDDALKKQNQNQLVAIRDTTARSIESYFRTIKNQVLTFSNDRMIIDAMRHFRGGFKNYRQQAGGNLEEEKVAVKDYYENQFGQNYRKLNNGKQANLRAMLSGLDEDSLALQSAYIAKNPQALGEKDGLMRAKQASDYNKYHGLYHPHIRDYLQKFQYYDIFLVDHVTGDIIYSVYKELDYTTSLIDGPYANSGIGQAFKMVKDSSDPNAVGLVDFASYSPSYEAPASFIASPIFDQGKKLGVLIFQMPIDPINEIMTHEQQWKTSGLGDSGETYLVGNDFTMRSMSRFLIEDTEAYLQLLQELSVPESVVSEIRSKATSIGLQPVKTVGTKAALEGETGFQSFLDYRGIKVLSAYQPIKVDGLNWAIMSEIDDKEAFAPTAQLKSIVILNSAIIIAITSVLAAVIGFFFALRTIEPINTTVTMLRDIAEGKGDLTQRLADDRRDELGDLAHWFNLFVQKLQVMVGDFNKSVLSLASVSTQLEVTSDETKKAIDGQHSQTEMMASAVTQMSASAEEVASNASSAALIAQETNTAAQEGLKVITRCQESIHALAEDIDEASVVIEALHQDSDQIDKVLGEIQGIAQQTNLLALNAAIEAARAGETGRGFAVVADEVRTLAKRTHDSTVEIQEIIIRLLSGTKAAVSVMDKSQGGVKDGKHAAETARVSFQHITESIIRMTDASTQIASAAEEQTYVSQEISENVNAVSDLSNQNNSRTENIASSSRELSLMSEDLKAMLIAFRV
jgi:methyl-accepting chemotaxis protein